MADPRNKRRTKLFDEIENPTVARSELFLVSRRQLLAPYDDLETYSFSTPDPLTNDLKGFEYHFHIVSNRVLQVLRSHNFFIGASVIADLLFAALKDGSVTTPVKEVLGILEDNGIHKPGIVLYPLHSLSIAGVGFLEALGKARFELIIPAAGIAVRAQTNNLGRTIRFLENATRQLKIFRRIPNSSLEHYARIPVLRWLTRNPLLIFRVQTFSNRYYENQAFIIIKLKIATTLLFFLGSLETGLTRNTKAWTGTGSVNNFQTLDLKHYVVFEPRPASHKAFEPRRVPMNVSPTELSELTAVPIEITPGLWMRRRKFVADMCSVLSTIETGYLRAVLYPKSSEVQDIAFRKMFSSLAYFRRSFRMTADVGEAYVNLAVAFEVLLTDSYSSGVDRRIRTRLRKCLKGVDGSRKLNAAVKVLYTARSEIVHAGQTTATVDVQLV